MPPLHLIVGAEVRFCHESLPQRIRFASGESREGLAAELEVLGATRPMLIAANAERALALKVVSDVAVVAHHENVVMHVPLEVAEEAREVATASKADVLVSVGGGSTTGLAKAIALTTGLPIVAVPTTYAGSEATNVWGITEQNRKTTGVDDRVLPRAIVYDAELTLSLPAGLSVASGMNSLAHGVDSLWGPRRSPISDVLATEAIRALNTGLPQVQAQPDAVDGREQVLYAAYLAAAAFSSAGSGLHHKICHVLGGMFNLPHAQTHATVLPYVLAFNGPAAPDACVRMASAFSCTTALEGLQRLRRTVNAPCALRDYGMSRDGIPAAAATICESVPASNPRSVSETQLVTLLEAAWAGADPSGNSGL